VNFSITVSDAMELGQRLQFLDGWLAIGHGPISESLARFAGWEAYGAESLRDDLASSSSCAGFPAPGDDVAEHAPMRFTQGCHAPYCRAASRCQSNRFQRLIRAG
jgi:hypothetical protein